MNPVEIAALDALDLLVVVDNETDTQLRSFAETALCTILGEMKGQYIWSVRWCGLIARV